MSLTKDEVAGIAHLARLHLTPAEIDEYQGQLSDCLDYIQQISELDLTDVPPTTHAVSQHNIMRADKATSPMPLTDVLANAPDHAQDQFRIQAILKDAT